jgi:hypothetical protein
MKRILITVALFLVLVGVLAAPVLAGGGFDQYGYNYTARIFNGTGESGL